MEREEEAGSFCRSCWVSLARSLTLPPTPQPPLRADPENTVRAVREKCSVIKAGTCIESTAWGHRAPIPLEAATRAAGPAQVTGSPAGEKLLPAELTGSGSRSRWLLCASSYKLGAPRLWATKCPQLPFCQAAPSNGPTRRQKGRSAAEGLRLAGVGTRFGGSTGREGYMA